MASCKPSRIDRRGICTERRRRKPDEGWKIRPECRAIERKNLSKFSTRSAQCGRPQLAPCKRQCHLSSCGGINPPLEISISGQNERSDGRILQTFSDALFGSDGGGHESGSEDTA